MKIWVDDLRPAPNGYIWCKTVNDAKNLINTLLNKSDFNGVSVIDLDHDAGIFAKQGGDYIKLVDWLVELVVTNELNPTKFPLAFHTMNSVGKENMLITAERNGFPIKRSEYTGK